MQKVYFDVGNTLNSPFITGIQRVTREIARTALNGNLRTEFEYVPVVFDPGKLRWRLLTNNEHNLLLSGEPRKQHILARINNKLRRLLPAKTDLLLDKFEQESIFLDIENSWHSSVHRAQLLPRLKAAGVKIVKLHYDLIPLMMPDTMPAKSVKKFTEHFLCHVDYADLFICISQCSLNDVTNYCGKHFMRLPKLATVRLGTTMFQGDGRKISARNENRYGRFILMVGTIEPRKNHDLVISAYDRIGDKTDLNLVLVGKKGWLTDGLYEKIKSHTDFGTKIHHLQQVSDEYLSQLYRSAWISVFPSHYEGYGLPVGEALSSGCASICSESLALREVGGNHVRYLSSNSANELAKIIIELDTNPAAYNELSSMARSYVATSWTDTVTDIEYQLCNL